MTRRSPLAGPAALAAGVAGALLGIAAAPAAAQAPDGYRWTVEEAVDGCELASGPVEGKPYVAARSVCVVPAPLDAVAAVLVDIERYPDWMQDCSQTKLLKVVDRARDAYVFWYRQHVALFSDRDMVLRSELVVREEDRRVIRAFSTSDVPYDAGRGYVRMPSFYSEWVLERIDAGRTRVSFLIDPDLADGLPVGLANATIRKTPLQTLRGLARMVALPRYAGQARAPGGAGAGAP